MKRIYLILLFLVFTTTYSQNNYSSDTYSVSKLDLESNTFPKDSIANALVIYEMGKSRIDDQNFNLIFEKKKKVKILNRDGFGQANITIYLYNNKKAKEKIKKIIAITHNVENGKIIKTQLKRENIYREKYNDNYTLIKFTLPNIKEGSVITYSYQTESPFIYKYKPWTFQDEIPKLYSEYNTSIPGNYEYNIKLVGELKLTTN